MADLERFTMEKLGDDNWKTWAQHMECLLVTKQLWAAVGNASHEKSLEAKALIGMFVRDQHLDTVMESPSAKAAWDELKRQFAAKSHSRRMALTRELTNLRMGDDESPTQYVARAKDIRTKLAAAGYNMEQEHLTNLLLNGLPAGGLRHVRHHRHHAPRCAGPGGCPGLPAGV
jgi:hypothetical protein